MVNTHPVTLATTEAATMPALNVLGTNSPGLYSAIADGPSIETRERGVVGHACARRGAQPSSQLQQSGCVVADVD